MITCVYCGDTTGPWAKLPEGFVCEECLEKNNKIIKKGE